MSTIPWIYKGLTVIFVVMMLLSGCGGSASPTQAIKPVIQKPIEKKATAVPVESVKEEAKNEMPAPSEPAAKSASGGELSEESAPVDAAKPASESYATDGDVAPTSPEMSRETDDGTRDEEAVTKAKEQQNSPLKAGEINDNNQWDDYLLYRRGYRGPQVHDLDITERYIIEAKDQQGNPLLDAQVHVFVTDQQQPREVYTARTYATGQTMFHPAALGLSQNEFLVTVEKDGLSKDFTLTRFNAQTNNNFTEKWQVTLDTPKTAQTINLDLLFLIDATGSMDDEIAKIQTTIYEVTARLDALPGRPNIRYGMVTYRDREDDFVTRSYDFTPDVTQFAKSLDTVSAGGGGDYPESLNEGLHKAIHQVEWRSDNTVKLVFLVADAPPHLDYEQDYDYAADMVTAAQQGIKIFPLASSGLDDQGEYVFRQLAQFTQGRFIFMTYATDSNSGAPGETTTHHVDDYSVENLDDLLVKLVTAELAYQTPRLTQ